MSCTEIKAIVCGTWSSVAFGRTRSLFPMEAEVRRVSPYGSGLLNGTQYSHRVRV